MFFRNQPLELIKPFEKTPNPKPASQIQSSFGIWKIQLAQQRKPRSISLYP